MDTQNREQSPANGISAQKLASALLGHNVADWIADRRPTTGKVVPWRLIARELLERTSGQVDVTAETLRYWHEGRGKKDAA